MTQPEDPSPETSSSAFSSLALDLSELRLMPDWAAPSKGDKGEERRDFSRYEESEGGSRRFGDRNGRPPGRDGRPNRGDGRPGRPPGRGDSREGRGDGRDGPRRGPRPGGPSSPHRGGDDRRPQRPWVELPQDVRVLIEPSDATLDALATHIRVSGQAFSMFDAARLVLARGDRFQARFQCANDRAQGLFQTRDGGLFLSRDEAFAHALRGQALEAFYRCEELELEAPKGDFKTIAVCGMSGELLGPPSHHSYQASLLRLHRERFAGMPLEVFKKRIRVESGEEWVERWRTQLSKGQRWVWLQGDPEQPTTFASRHDMEQHFRRIHGEEAVQEKRDVAVVGSAAREQLSAALGIIMRKAMEGARKHLFELSQRLGAGFERRGLKLFKRRGSKQFVCRVKPKAVDSGVVFSERVARIVQILQGAKSGLKLRELVENIEPSPPQEETAPQAPIAAVESPSPEASAEATADAANPAAEGSEASAAAKPAARPQWTPAQIAVIKDIRWLANEGYIIDYSDGMVFLGVQAEQPRAAKPSKPGANAQNAQSTDDSDDSDDSTEEAEGSEEQQDESSQTQADSPSQDQAAAAAQDAPVHAEPAPAVEAAAEPQAETSQAPAPDESAPQ